MRKRDPNRIEMGRRFREARERLNWSREVLAERADLSVSFIADLELGNTGTRLENFIRLCRLLDLTDRPGDIADPWYTGDFDTTYAQLQSGCQALLHRALEQGAKP